jgi:2-dehydro-3-deoxyglucarate aldolase/4-hydroxy-2-oxoheptanedioate aldolase
VEEEIMKTSFIEKMNAGEPAIGTLVTFENPEVAEILSLCGFDWLFLDMEHGAFSTSAVQHMLQAIKGNCSAIVRVPENSSVWIKKALDTGCDGIIVPLVNNVEEAKKAIAAAKYPPLGTRSVGIARAHGYGMSFAEYISCANENIALIVQIEHIDAVKNIDAILENEGIDGVLIGPYDLSGSMNMLGHVTSEPVQRAISQIKEKCQEKSIPVGIFVMKAEAAQKEIDDGCSFVAVGIDSSLLWNAAKNILSTIESEVVFQ